MIDRILLGQGLVLQLRDSDKVGHEAPPACGAFAILRLLVCCPPPHVTGQLLHVDQLPTSQSTIKDIKPLNKIICLLITLEILSL